MEQEPTALVPVSLPAAYPKYIRLDQLIPRLSIEQAKQHWFFSEQAARIHMTVLGAPGSGKSRLLGRLHALHLVKKRKPLVIIDPTGGTINNLLDCIGRLPRVWQKQLWPRITYIDVGATDYVSAQPLYYRLGERDTWFTIANRLPSIIKRQDKDLQSAPILGWNSLYECAINAGMIAAVLGRQLDFVAALVQHPERYKEELKQVLASNPMLQPAVTYFRELMDPGRTTLRERRTGSLMTKLIPFLSDPLLLATFSGKGKGIDWERVAQEGETVLIDLRHVPDPDLRQFAMLWYFKAFTDFVEYRGIAGRKQPITFVIDELADMLAQHDRAGRSLLAQDLEELAARHARNYGVKLIFALQSLASVEPSVQNVLLQMGTLVAGRIANYEEAITLAKHLLMYDPYRVKKVEKVWMNVAESLLADQANPFFFQHERSIPTVIDHRTVEFTPEEQYIMFANKLMQLQRFAFLVRAATGEGQINHTIRELSIANRQPGYPDEAYIAYLRSCLRQACGVPVTELLEEINQRRPTGQLEAKPAQKPASKANEKTLAMDDKIGEQSAHESSHPLPRTTPAAGAAGDRATPKAPPPADDEAITWR